MTAGGRGRKRTKRSRIVEPSAGPGLQLLKPAPLVDPHDPMKALAHASRKQLVQMLQGAYEELTHRRHEVQMLQAALATVVTELAGMRGQMQQINGGVLNSQHVDCNPHASHVSHNHSSNTQAVGASRQPPPSTSPSPAAAGATSTSTPLSGLLPPTLPLFTMAPPLYFPPQPALRLVDATAGSDDPYFTPTVLKSECMGLEERGSRGGGSAGVALGMGLTISTTDEGFNTLLQDMSLPLASPLDFECMSMLEGFNDELSSADFTAGVIQI